MFLLLSSALSIYTMDCLQCLGLVQRLDTFRVSLEQITAKQEVGGAFLESVFFLLVGC